MHAWTSPCNPDPLKPGVKLMAGCNSAGVGVTSVSLPVVNSYVSKTCDKGVKGRRMLLCRVELCDRDECIKADFNDLYKDRCSLLSKPARGTQRFCVRRVGILDYPSFQILCPQVLES